MRRSLLLFLGCVLAVASPEPLSAQPADTARFEGIPSGAEVATTHLPRTLALLDADGQRVLGQYARVVFHPQTVQTEAHLMEALALRDSVISHLTPVLENDPFEDLDAGLDFADEVRTAGLVALMAEGFVFGVGPGIVLEEQAARLGSPDLILYLRFREAEAMQVAGEYPYMSLEDELEMIVIGEALRRDYPDSPYVEATREAFEDALLLFMSLHRAGESWFVGPATTEFYPYASTDQDHHAFVRDLANSAYHPVVERLLAMPSEAAMDGPIEAIVVQRGSEEAMRQSVLGFLDDGVDVLGVLFLTDGEYGAVYRYFPAGDVRAAEALTAARGQGLSAEIVTLTPDRY